MALSCSCISGATYQGSGRFFQVDWHVTPRQGATVEARLKAISCSEPWGVALLVSDGEHEEGVTFFLHQVMLTASHLTARFDEASQFHTYRVQIKGTDIQVWAADLLTLPGGEVLCFMRTGGSGGKYTPLYLCRSADEGKTWSTLQPIADRGVWPNACRMRNGVIVCTYGRPGNWLAFSLDDERSWTGHFCFYTGPTTSYNSVEEVAPDQLLVVYDRRQLDANGNVRPEIVGTTVTVRR